MALSPEQLVVSRPLVSDQALLSERPLPLVISPSAAGLDIDLTAWVREHKAQVEADLARVGGILFRGFGIRSAAVFRGFIEDCFGPLLEYTDHATPRRHVAGHVYTSTEYPADQPIELHNECAYARSWPRKVFFHCATPPTSGGETPIADCRRVLQHLSPDTIARFRAAGVMYVRNFEPGFGQSCAEVLGTSDLEQARAICRAADIELEIRDNGRLRTRQRRDAVIAHPATGEPVWFNQATAFHITSVEPSARALLLAEFGEEGVSKNAFFGDGTPIDAAVLAEIREAYRQETVSFPWQQGDVLMLDNVLVAHGRAPYSGPRQILVGMVEPC